MARQFSDTSTNQGLVQLYEKELGGNFGDVSGNTAKLQEFTGDANDALDDFKILELTADGTWQADDINHTDYAIVSTNLVSGQADYPFNKDETNNYILEVLDVYAADASGSFHRLSPVDVPTGVDTIAFVNTESGTPNRYDKLAQSIVLDPIPNYNYTNGLKMYVSRTGSYFTTSDTTKVPGIPAIFHKYIAIKAALTKAERDNLTIAERLFRKVQMMERDIVEYFAFRNGDVRKRLSVAQHSNK